MGFVEIELVARTLKGEMMMMMVVRSKASGSRSKRKCFAAWPQSCNKCKKKEKEENERDENDIFILQTRMFKCEEIRKS